MSDNDKGLFQMTVPVPAVYLHVLKPHAYKKKGSKAEGGDPKYSLNLLFAPDSAELKAMKSMAAAVAKEKWPGRALSELKFPFSDGTKAADKAKQADPPRNKEFGRGKVVLAPRSKILPILSATVNSRFVEYDEHTIANAAPYFYPGVEVLAELRFVAYEGGGNPDGVTAYLNRVLSTNKGERIIDGSGRSGGSRDAFSGYLGKNSAENPLDEGGDDDEIPF